MRPSDFDGVPAAEEIGSDAEFLFLAGTATRPRIAKAGRAAMIAALGGGGGAGAGVAVVEYDGSWGDRPDVDGTVIWFSADPTAGNPAGAIVGDLVLLPKLDQWQYALGDQSTAVTAGTGKLTIRAPQAMTVTGVRASLKTASTGAVFQVDINVDGVSMLSTKLTIDAGAKTSTTATTPVVISDTSIPDDAELVFDIDGVGTGAVGPIVTILGYT